MTPINLETSTSIEFKLCEEQLHIVQEALEKALISQSLLQETNNTLQQQYVFLKEENTLLFNQLSLIQNEIVDRYISSPNPYLFDKDLVINSSDVDKVKQHLSYKLGNTLIQNSKSLLGWIKMPWLLYREVRTFRLNKNRLKKEN